MPPTRPNTPAYWIFVPALACSGFVLTLWLAPFHRSVPKDTSDRWIVAFTLITFLTALAGLVCRSVRQDRAASIFALVILALYWAVGACLFFGFTAQSIFGLLYIWPILLVILAIVVPATISSSKRLNPDWTSGATVTGVLSGAILIFAIQAAKEADRNFPRPLDPLVLAPDMVTVAKCAESFASSHPDSGYPQSIAQLGPQGTACLPEAVLKSPSKGFALAYQPGTKDAAGKITAYTATAREAKPNGPDVTTIFTNEFGLIRYRYDGPHGKGGTYVYFPAQYPLHELLRCLQNATNGPTTYLTSQANETISDPYENVSRCLGPDMHPAKREFAHSGYDFNYTIQTAGAGTIIGYTIAARPDPYGATGIRSYYAVATLDKSKSRNALNIYATPEDRPATPEDPLAQAREAGLTGVGELATTDQ